MRAFASLLTIGLSFLLTMPAFGRVCSSAHTLDLARDGQFLRRQALLPDDFPDWIPTHYSALGALGQSRQVAMLAERQGRWVVVKFNHFPDKEVYRNIWRELAVTEFFLSAGEDLPRIVELIYGPEGQLAVVKNYEEGIVGSELGREFRFLRRHFDADERYKIQSDLKKTIMRLRDLFHNGRGTHSNFVEWYRKNFDQLTTQHPKLFGLAVRLTPEAMAELATAPKDDITKENMIFSFRDRRWKPFDP